MSGKLDLAIRGGTIVTPSGRWPGAIGIRSGRIVVAGSDAWVPPAVREIDARGLHVLPGGIDCHVHLREPGLEHKEDIATGTRAAVFGGMTTVLDMPNTIPATASAAAVQDKQERARNRAHCDVGFYGVVLPTNLDKLVEMVEAGVVGFKVFLAETVGRLPSPDDGVLLDALEVIAGTGRRVAFHAENDAIVQRGIARARSAGRREPLAHHDARPVVAELEAINRAALLAKAAGARIHICHLAAAAGLEALAYWRGQGVDVTAETGPQNCFLSVDDMERLGSRMTMNPPVRTRRDGQALLEALASGALDAIATDHTPHTHDEKLGDDVWATTPGMVGVETVLALFLSNAVRTGRLSLERLVYLTSEGPARAWGLYPTKGSLAIGADADFALVDLNETWTIREQDLHSKHNVTPFDGMTVTGRVVTTIVRGNVVLEQGRLVGDPVGVPIGPGGEDLSWTPASPGT